MKQNYLSVLLVALVATLAGCGKDGEPGAGYSDAVKYGGITITLSGKRPTDSVEFKSVQQFKFSPVGNNVHEYSSVTTDPQSESKYFVLTRYLSGVDYHVNSNYFEMYLDMTKKDSLEYLTVYMTTTVVDGSKYFDLNHYASEAGTDTVLPVTVSNYSYNSKTGRLKFNFEWVQPKENSSTGYELKAVGVVDVVVMEPLNNIGSNEG